MTDSSILDKVQKLLSLATRGDGEEARTAALIAARLIVEHGMVGTARVEECRSCDELRETVQRLLASFMNAAWEGRRKGHLVTVPLIVDLAIQEGALRPSERAQGINMLANLVNQQKKRGVLVSVRGRYGGYRLAAGVRRSHARHG